MAMMLRFWLKKPVLLELYGIDAWQPTRSPLTNRLISQVDFFVSISEVTRQRFLSWSLLPDEKGFLLPNAIHLDEYGPGEKNPELLRRYGLEGKKVLMTLGRLASYERCKGFDEVLDLLPDLALSEPEVVYLVVGKGDDQARLEAKARALGIADRVVFTGFIHESEKADHYRLADVYVMPSRGEGFGFVLLEAMACGIPVIASTLDGGREAVLNGELGSLVDPDDPGQVKAAIIAALAIETRFVPAGLAYFEFNSFSARLLNILNSVIPS
jgi:glycosyltransferase involved in cell wall biosynthesis